MSPSHARSIASRLALAIAAAIPTVAAAKDAPECRIRVIQPVTDDLGNHWSPGQTLPVDIARTGSGTTSYCAHGGSCIPTTVDGATATRLLGCHPGRAIDPTDRLLVFDRPHG